MKSYKNANELASGILDARSAQVILANRRANCPRKVGIIKADGTRLTKPVTTTKALNKMIKLREPYRFGTRKVTSSKPVTKGTIQHPKFGTGKVIGFPAEDRVKIRFWNDEERIFVHSNLLAQGLL